MRGFGTDGRPLRIQTSRWLTSAAATRSGPVRARHWIGRLLVARARPAVLSGCAPPCTGHNLAHDRCRAGRACGRARPRRRRGGARLRLRRHRASHPRAQGPRLFADMRFTMARPEVSCHPETFLAGARPSSPRPTATMRPNLRSRRDRQGSRATRGMTATSCCANGSSSWARLGGEYRVLVDANQHVDREAAARAGVGFYGKNTMLITRRHGSWVVLGTLVTTAEVEATASARARLRVVHALHRGVPDRRARRSRRRWIRRVSLVLDAGAGADPGGLSERARRADLRL